ncbi:MAG: acyl-CoA synthetase [Acidimicrobiales bacterium]|nr:MAG: acyl-CoA synthetase [Acidimicrobiales bacterium]
MDFALAEVFETVAHTVGDRDCIVQENRRYTYRETLERSYRLGNHLHSLGLGCRRERSELEPWESGQDHVGLYMHNCPEYLEGMIGCYSARVAPFNVNYRYVEAELIYLLNDARAKGLIFHSAFADRVASVRESVPTLEHLIQVDDGSDVPLLEGAVWYHDALAASSATRPPVRPTPDDLYILYTGGTTGMPKGVLWRQGDIFPAALGGRAVGTHKEFDSLEEIAENARSGGLRMLPTAPFMHGAAHWLAFNGFTGGHTIVLPRETRHLDPAEVWATVERERVGVMLIVGDAFARPLLDELADGRYDTSSLFLLISGGAALNAAFKKRFLELMPQVSILDAVGASETGQQANHMAAAGSEPTTGTFTPGSGACVVSSDMTRILDPSEREVGWLAQRGRVPLGYLGDPEKTKKTFPVVDGERISVPGDRARWRDDGTIELLGRDSVTINTGGEKVFAEEVENVLRQHPAVYDAVVCGRPSERWGEEVVAVVQLREGASVTPEDLLGECEKTLARYKLPKDFVFVERVVRSPAGKADYRWAREVAAKAAIERS